MDRARVFYARRIERDVPSMMSYMPYVYDVYDDNDDDVLSWYTCIIGLVTTADFPKNPTRGSQNRPKEKSPDGTKTRNTTQENETNRTTVPVRTYVRER